MKILFLIDYFYPFAHGGSEWSLYYLMQSLIKKGFQLAVFTPDYGAAKDEVWRKIRIHRYPFLIKFKRNKSGPVSPFWFTNLIHSIISTVSLLTLINKLRPDVIHLQGNYLLPAVWVCRVCFKIPVIVTIRDYQIICPLGLCLSKRNKYQKCNYKFFFKEELPQYLSSYSRKKSLMKSVFIIIAFLRLRLIYRCYSFLLRRVDKLICISKKQAKIYAVNGFTNTQVIYNSFNFPKINSQKIKNQIIYIGRLTPGKGADILLDSYRDIREKEKNNLIIVGQGFLENKLRNMIRKHHMEDRVVIKGHLEHTEVLKLLKKSKLCVVPSVWEEPFGRVALEALVLGVPVVASNRGGLPEIVENNLTGYVVGPNKTELTKGINKALANNNLLRNNLKQQRTGLNYKFNLQVVGSYIKLYQSL